MKPFWGEKLSFMKPFPVFDYRNVIFSGKKVTNMKPWDAKKIKRILYTKFFIQKAMWHKIKNF